MITQVNRLQDFIQIRNDLETEDIGFVPTMGNLHDGHLRLMEKALSHHKICIVSIFVNPTQFAENEDLATYPRTLKEDIEKIKMLERKFEKTVIVFHPEVQDIYPSSQQTTYSDLELRNQLEGSVRPTHFDGVTTVVKRLFEIVKPKSAYFGKKDYQQYIIIKRMVDRLHLNINICGVETVRNQEGLALSSRNHYLNSKELKKALKLRKTLLLIKEKLNQVNELSEIEAYLETLKSEESWNYLEIRDPKNLSKVESLGEELVILGNYQVGQTRLLDNLEWSRN
jgi:pantoate--beta-alanine ligase